MAALLTGQRLTVLALLDGDKAGRDAQQELVRGRLLSGKSVFFVNEALGPDAPEADIEDLLDPAVYEDLARRSYAKELGKTFLKLNENVPRIVKRFELAFSEAGLNFDKGRPARLFLSEMSSRPSDLIDAGTAARFEKLFAHISDRLGAIV